MAYDEHFAQRIRELMADGEEVIEKKMFGGLAFMLRDKMFCGVMKEDMMVRCLPERYEELLEKPGCRPMDFTGRPMRGLLFVAIENLNTNKDLRWWLDVGAEFVMKTPEKKKKKK
jgi:TfoX/Sxy family transcriptional regulator of competence genes